MVCSALIREDLVLTKQYAQADATELEGEVTKEQADSGNYHYDSSVEVCGNDREDRDCDCRMDCDCERCTVCLNSGANPDRCDYPECQRCDSCDGESTECECHAATMTEGCSDCVDATRLAETRTACSDCNSDNFFSSCYADCDTEIECDYDCGCEVDHNCSSGSENVDGEMVSPPLPPKELTQWIRDNYPVKTNTSCGAHRHRSFTHIKYYSILMNRQFHEYLIRRLKAWGNKVGVREGSALFRRLNGDVHWCKAMYDGYNQISTSSKEDCRYRIINYCWKLHGTLEIRVLPAFQDVELTVSAHKELGDIMDDYITQEINSLTPRRRVTTYP